MKCFSKSTLKRANLIARRRNYNRQLTNEFIHSLPQGTWFPVIMTLPHEHAHGVKVPLHYRCQLVYNEKGETVWIDCDPNLYRLLDVVEAESESA